MTTQINGTTQIKNTTVTAAKLNLTLDQITPPVASVDLNSQLITNLLNPVSAQDATSKNYVDTAITAAVQGLTPKGSVNAATTGALPAYTYDNGTSGVGATLTGNANGAFPTIDGISATLNNLYLVKSETSGNAPYNGLYQLTQVGDGSTPYILTRTTNFDSSATIVPNSYVFVSTGTTLHDTGWILNLDGTCTVGTTNIVFTQFSGAGTYTAGTAIDITSQAISVKYDNSTIGVNGSNQIYVPNGGIGTSQLAGSIPDSKLATITTGNKVSGSAVQIKTGAALSDSTGLQVVTDGTTIEVNTGALRVKDGGISTAKIADSAVTLAKIANAAANSKLVGSGASGSGSAYVEISLGAGLSMSGSTLNTVAGPTFVTGEVPSGTIDGSNTVFSLANSPIVGSVALMTNGLRQEEGVDYTIDGADITFEMGSIPQTGDTLLADYRY